jgi:hypothetical protein
VQAPLTLVRRLSESLNNDPLWPSRWRRPARSLHWVVNISMGIIISRRDVLWVLFYYCSSLCYDCYSYQTAYYYYSAVPWLPYGASGSIALVVVGRIGGRIHYADHGRRHGTVCIIISCSYSSPVRIRRESGSPRAPKKVPRRLAGRTWRLHSACLTLEAAESEGRWDLQDHRESEVRNMP